MIDDMDAADVREVLLDEGVQDELPPDLEGLRDRLRVLTYCNYQSYSFVDAIGEVHHDLRLSRLRELQAECAVGPETPIWAAELGDEWLPFGEFRRGRCCHSASLRSFFI